ncbi:PREDICTED: uncharacterized protein LOC106809936 [Priapulus caudatus]|uniref:Uncharacterized protein LOC106809936 n=1 Tax=Priapulus caudatus TaxID=37621 RepID=A0ABM1E8Z1_PRICU|nr:PREDICTED: uncharacterized protein LOC106809936 [Priapulus caudatus]XP_014668662.1 PREDICTED: uncharacterized protein LOC106809936 [Priapulus caudatus]XP_014668663.1 PREDICTED: uncharacterized protein LOC106809936 [Priapulus caudatus]
MVGAAEYGERDCPVAMESRYAAGKVPLIEQQFRTKRLGSDSSDNTQPLLAAVHSSGPGSPAITPFSRAELREQIAVDCRLEMAPPSPSRTGGATNPVAAVRKHLALEHDQRCRKASGEGAVCTHTPSAERIVADDCDDGGATLELIAHAMAPRAPGLHRSPSQENIWALLFAEQRDERENNVELDESTTTFFDETDMSMSIEREGSSVSLNKHVMKVEVEVATKRHFSDSILGKKTAMYRPSVRFYIGDGANTEDEISDDSEVGRRADKAEEVEYPRYGAKTGRVGSISCPQGPGIIINQSQVPICRICLFPGDDREALITPCRCSGTMKHVHYTCLMKWLQIIAKRSKKQPSCELCNYPYQRHKKFRTNQWQFPSVSRRDKILHGIFIFCIVIMIGCATSFILCFKKDGGQRSSDDLQLTREEVLTLACGVLFFGAFFTAMYVQVKAKNTVYKLIVKFFGINHTWTVYEYDKTKDAAGGGGKVQPASRKDAKELPPREKGPVNV